MGRAKLLKLHMGTIVLLVFVLLWAMAGVAQDKSPNAPVQYQPFSSPSGASDDNSSSSASGVRSYFAPVFRFMESADSNPQLNGTQSNLEAASIVSGDLALHHVWRHAMTNLLYQGGATFYTNSTQMNSWFQRLGIEQKFVGRRSTVTISNYFTYLPESNFGFSGFGFSTYPGMQPSPGSDTIAPPAQSLLTSFGSQYTNSSSAQWDYKMTARSTVSFSGSYGLLRFDNSGFYDSDSYGAGASYFHQIGRGHNLGVSYQANLVRYSEVTTEFDTHAAQLEYKYSTNKRFSVQMGAGPQYLLYTFGGIEQRSVQPTGHFGLTSHWGRTDLGLTYVKAVTTGSGVIQGSKSDVGSVYASRRLTRHWSGSVSTSYAHNSTIQPIGGVAYDTETVGASLNRSIGRTVTMFMQYSLGNQSTSSGTNSALAGNVLRHTFGVGLSWGPHNIPVTVY